jgi:predicted Fe-Mo cluster-binding NifX family protein
VKIALTAMGDGPDAILDTRFGRAEWFLIYDQETDAFEVIDNEENQGAVQGAGVQAAETVVRAGAQVLITGHCGPKAFRALNAADVTVYNTDAETVAEALARFAAGMLEPANNANVPGHWAGP